MINNNNIYQRAAANTKKYLITVYSPRRYYDGIFPYNLLPYNLPGVSLDTDTVTTVIVTVIVWSLDQARTHLQCKYIHTEVRSANYSVLR